MGIGYDRWVVILVIKVGRVSESSIPDIFGCKFDIKGGLEAYFPFLFNFTINCPCSSNKL